MWAGSGPGLSTTLPDLLLIEPSLVADFELHYLLECEDEVDLLKYVLDSDALLQVLAPVSDLALSGSPRSLT